MRKLLTWLLVTLGVAALVRKLRRRREEAEQAAVGSVATDTAPAAAPEPTAAEPATADPADELRRKLAETRTDDEGSAEPADASVDERRAEVHEQGRATPDQMQPPGEG